MKGLFGCGKHSKKFKFENEYDLLEEPIHNAEYIPLRLTQSERKVQRLMRGIILASCYTDKVDSQSALQKKNRDNMIVKEITNALTGLIIGLDINKAATLLKEKDFTPYKSAICLAIETCRRYKIMNPDMLRTDYVKFLYMVQDAVQSETLNEILGFSVATELITVGRYCRENKFEEMLQDPRLPLSITPVPLMKNRDVLNKCLRCKDQTVNELLKSTSAKFNVEENTVEIAVRSLNDANCFSNDNVKTTEQLLDLLKTYFKPDAPTPSTDLSITEGKAGSRLTHEHRRQYYYVLQSLTLWKNICRQMYSLWTIAEEDMLNPFEKYELRSTGQGLQRVQKAPNLYKAIQEVLAQTKKELGEWVGSERIHLGDDQVPNAFHFIDKYGQVSRILIPILRTLEQIDLLESGEVSRLRNKADCAHYKEYLAEVWGSGEKAKKAVLRDFFQYGFDGSGGDNMEDAGSCIDGRLTSAWNWCNNIRFKPFYPLFLLAGFSSFDGDLSI